MHVSGDDMVLITATPLMEMVWSQSEGLSLQCVASPLGDTKASVLWDTESFNVVVSSPKCTNDGEWSSPKDIAEGTSGELKLSKKMEVDLSQISGKKQLAEKVVTSYVDTLQTPDKVFDTDMPGLQPDCLACNLKELKPDMLLPNVECESDVRYSPSHVEELDHNEIFQTSNLLPADEGCSLTKCGRSLKASSSTKSAEYSYIDMPSNGRDCLNGQMIPGKRTSEGERQTSDIGVNICGLPQPTGDAVDRSFRASDKGKSVLIASPYIDNLDRSNRGKGKAQVLFDTEDRESTLKASACSDDSVESCNGKRLFSRGKRASNYDLKMSIECKRSKKQLVEGSSSNSLLRQTGSFMNWALTITKGFSRFCGATALTSAPPLSNQVVGNLDCRSLSHEDVKDTGISHGDMGFKSIFESTYLLSSNVKNVTTANERAKGLKAESKQFAYSNSQTPCKKLEFNLHRMLPTESDRVGGASKPSTWCNFRSLHIVCDGGGNELHKEISSTEEMTEENIHQVNEFLSAKSNLSRSNSRFHENLKCDSGPTGDLGSIGSTCSAPKNGCQPSPIGKRSGTIVASRKLVSKNKTELLQNLWITRFSPKVSSTTTKLMQCMELGLQGSTKSYGALEPLSQNYAFHSKDQGCLVNNSEMNLIAHKRKEHLKVGDEKFNSKLIPILPSCKVQKMEMPVSSFANRLNMHSCSKLSEVPDNVTPTSTACFFCGKSRHGVRACT